MSKQYIYVERLNKNAIKHVYVNDAGEVIKETVPYRQSVWEYTKAQTEWKDIHGNHLEKIAVDSLKDYVEEHQYLRGHDYAGELPVQYQFIADTYKGQTDFDLIKIPKMYWDIEVFCNGQGFPDPWEASQPIISIAFYLTKDGTKHVFGLKDYTGNDKEIIYRKFRDEKEMVSQFLSIIHSNVACLIGFNSDGFDIPYLINRSCNIGVDLKSLLPLGKYYDKGNKLTFKSYAIPGIVRMDWMNLVKKYDAEKLERYSLDFVAKHYLGDEEGKLEYLSEFKTLDEFYENDFNRFIDYNMQDVMLLVELEKKKSFVDISFQLAYLTRTLPEDIYSNTKLWDVYIYNTLIEKGIVIPKDKHISKTEKYEGAYVTPENELKRGMHDWVIIRDVASEYPSCMIAANMSALSKVQLDKITPVMDTMFEELTVNNFLAGKVKDEHVKYLKDNKIGLAPEGAFFHNDKEDIICKMLADLFQDRKKYRKMAKDPACNPKDKLKYEQLVYSIKILMNSLYGAVGSEYFRYGDVAVATSVTKLGQIMLRYAATKVTEYFKEKFQYDPWLYSDTDSIFFKMAPVVDDWNKKTGKVHTKKEIVDFLDQFDKRVIAPIIDKSFQEVVDKLNLFRNHFEMVKEKTCNRILLSKPKHYILSLADKEGKYFEDPVYGYKGIEIVRTSTPKKVREVLKDTMKYLFTECKDEIELYEYTQKVKSNLWDKLTINEISFPRGVSDMSDDWKPVQYNPKEDALVFKKGTPIAVKAAWVYNFTIDKMGLEKKYPKLRNKDKVKWVYLKMPNPFKSPIVAFSESYFFPEDSKFNLNKYVDRDLQFEKAYFDVVQRIVESIGWNLDRGSQRIETLF